MATKLFTKDFDMWLKHCGRAKRFKVHGPDCSCPKLTAFRSILRPGLVVLPDTKSASSAYLHPIETKEFDKDPLFAESKLRDEMNLEENKIKVSCAQCLLKHHPNGFVCISSPSKSTVDLARDLARQSVKEKKQQAIKLYADHAHFVCTLPRKLLWVLSQKKVVRKEQQEEFAQRLVENNVEVSKNAKIRLQHHVLELLRITKNSVDANTAYWFVLGYRDAGNVIVLDLPGGKRHLGETCLEAAIRETQEESSLDVDESWKVAFLKPKGKDIVANGYYIMRPPADLIMESISQTDFWKKPGFCKEPSS